MSYTIKQFTRADLEKIARERDDVEIYTEVHDRVYEPWAQERLQRTFDFLVALTLKMSAEEGATSGDIRARAVAENTDASEFASTHKHMFEKLTTPEFVRDDRALRGVQMLLSTFARMKQGVITEQQAREHAAGVAVRYALETDGEKTASSVEDVTDSVTASTVGES